MDLIFLGGISRAGKAALWPLLCSLEYTDQPQNFPNLDWLNSAYLLGDISEDVFLNFVRLEIQKSSWFSFLGRNLNSNEHDWTNFKRLRGKNELDSRLKRKDCEIEFNKFCYDSANRRFIPVYNTNIKLSQKQQEKVGFNISYIHIITK